MCVCVCVCVCVYVYIFSPMVLICFPLTFDLVDPCVVAEFAYRLMVSCYGIMDNSPHLSEPSTSPGYSILVVNKPVNSSTTIFVTNLLNITNDTFSMTSLLSLLL